MPWNSYDGQQHSRNGRVLVVDDDDGFRRVMRLVLNNGGYDVVEAEDGAHALEIMRAGTNPMVMDLIICGIRMPHANGFEAVTTFRQEFPSIPVIVFTGFRDAERTASLLEQGVTNYRPKPIERDKLLAVVAKAMEQRITLRGLTVIASTRA
jgi:two-component system, chemotaxis family, chemotaxis protein CheY